MTLLRFRFENHKSFRDQAELSLLDSRLKTNRPLEGSWANYTHRVAALYGPNAAGKSSVLDALEYMIEVIRNSATVWRKRPNLPQHPFRLDEGSRRRPSHFSLDFVVDEVRHEYGFSLTRKGVQSEWLYDYPVGRQRLLFERNLDGMGVTKFGRALGGGTSTLAKLTGEQELLLSRGANDRHPLLTRISDALTEGFVFAKFSEGSREQRLNDIAEGLATDTIHMDDIIALLQAADVGIAEVRVAEVKTPPELLRWLEAVQRASDEVANEREPGAKSADDSADSEFSFKVAIEEVRKRLAFEHLGEGGNFYTLSPTSQSTGTLSWLSLAVPAVEALRSGTVLLIDEIDASLHPQLSQVLLQMFKDPTLNPKAAQLIFTTHDTYFMSPSADVPLDSEEVWFVEKSREGASELFPLSDFSTRSDQNVSRRYLHGRYGATPHVAPSFLERLVAGGDKS